MKSEPRCGCRCSITKTQLSKTLVTLLFLGSDMGMAFILSQLISSSFAFPLYLSCWHVLLSFVLAWLILRTEVEGGFIAPLQPVRASWGTAGLLGAQGLCFALTTGLFYASLRQGGRSWSLVLRGLLPFFAALFSVLPLKQRVKPSVWLAVVVLATGVGLAMYQPLMWTPAGLVLAVGSALAEAAFLSLSEYAMNRLRLDALNLLYYTAPPALLCLLPFFGLLEFLPALRYVLHHFWLNVFLVCATSILAFVQAVSRYQLLRFTSCVYTAAVESVRLILLLLIAEIVLYSSSRERLSLPNQLGVVLGLTSFGYLCFVHYSEDSYQLPAGSLPDKLSRVLHESGFERLDDNYVPDEERRFSIGSITDDDDVQEVNDTELDLPVEDPQTEETPAITEGIELAQLSVTLPPPPQPSKGKQELDSEQEEEDNYPLDDDDESAEVERQFQDYRYYYDSGYTGYTLDDEDIQPV